MKQVCIGAAIGAGHLKLEHSNLAISAAICVALKRNAFQSQFCGGKAIAAANQRLRGASKQIVFPGAWIVAFLPGSMLASVISLLRGRLCLRSKQASRTSRLGSRL